MTNAIPGVAVVGCGYWGRNLVRDFHSLGALKAVCDADNDIAQRLAEQYHVQALTYEEVLAQENIEGVAIAAPAELHADLALKALAAGKHVYVEKPIALSIPDAQAMISAADEAGLVLMVGHLLQYHPVFMKLKELVRAGELGRIRYIYSRRLSLGKLRTEENVLWSFAPHDISMILALVGDEPEEVHGFAANYLQRNISDFAFIHMRFPHGVRAHVEASWLNPFKEQRLVVVGEKAMAEFCDSEPEWEQKLKIYRHVAEIRNGVPVVKKAEPELVKVERGNPLVNECAHFLRFMRNNEAPYTDGREALTVLKVLQAGDVAMEEDA